MRRLTAFAAALLLPAIPPLLLGTAAFTGALLVSQPPARAQSAEAVAKVAQAITVRIEGATQGSGVLVKRDGNRYTVLTAWHVVSGQSKGEELDIYTPDGQRHQFDQGSIRRLGNHDLASLSFVSAYEYAVASISSAQIPSKGDSIMSCGFKTAIDQNVNNECEPHRGSFLGYEKDDNLSSELTYNAKTYQGFSGGAILEASGNLIGIHIKGEADEYLSRSRAQGTKTGINRGQSIFLEELAESKIISIEDLSKANARINSQQSLSPRLKTSTLACDYKDANKLQLNCQNRTRESGKDTIAAKGRFETYDITKAKERRCQRDTMLIVNTAFNLLLPWNWLKKIDNKCVGYTFKARFYSEANSPFCGVIISRYPANYEIAPRESYAEREGRLEPDLLRLWDELKSDREEGMAYFSKSITSATLTLNSGPPLGGSFELLPPDKIKTSDPALVGESNLLFDAKESHKSQPMFQIKKLVTQQGRADNLIVASKASNDWWRQGLRIEFSDGSSYSFKLGSDDEKKIAKLYNGCQ